MTISHLMHTSTSSHFCEYMSMASCNFVTDVGVRSVLTSWIKDYTALSAFPRHPLCEE